MKKLAILTIALVALMFALGGFVHAESTDDIQAIKKAVKENPNYEPGKEVKWFKVLVTDNKAGKDKVRITLPLSLVETFVKCSGNDHVKLDHGQTDIDFGQLFAELKKVGPMAIIEVFEEDETVKVWLE
jgi:sugar phosphate isomerase/epimerase